MSAVQYSCNIHVEFHLMGCFYSQQLEATSAKVEQLGGQINQPIFSFLGGRRFHFIAPSGNEFVVWGDA